MKLPAFAVLSFLVLFLVVPAFSGTGDPPAAAGKKVNESCPAYGKEIIGTEKDAALEGKILCMHCDLHKADKCQKVLVTADSKIYKFCPDTIAEKDLAKLSGKDVKVKGTVLMLKDADAVIEVETLTAK